MHIDDLISEFIGALANICVKNGSGSLKKEEFLEILKNAKIESSQDFYKKPSSLLRFAHKIV